MCPGVKTCTVTLSLLVLILSACGGGSSSQNNKTKNPTLTGQILDSYVEGLRYTTNTKNGTTTNNGEFHYINGESVSFYVGDILIGTTTAKPVVTPFDFVPSANNVTDNVADNIFRFLITLDDDGNPDNGIVIAPDVSASATGQTLDFTMTTGFDAAAGTVLSTVTGGKKNTLVDIATVQNHVRAMLINALHGNYSGHYSSGSDNGTWMIAVDSAGSLTGSSTSSADMTAMPMTGTLNDNGSFALTGTDSGSMLSFKGQFDLQGGVTGTWGNGMSSGSFGNMGADAAADNSIRFYSIDYGNKVFMQTKPVSKDTPPSVTRYSFYNSPNNAGPGVFTPNYDMISFTLTISNSSKRITTIVYNYYNTGASDNAAVPTYHYQVVCGSIEPDPCSTVSFNPAAQTVAFNATRILPIPSTSQAPNAATTNAIISGSLTWQ